MFPCFGFEGKILVCIAPVPDNSTHEQHFYKKGYKLKHMKTFLFYIQQQNHSFIFTSLFIMKNIHDKSVFVRIMLNNFI